MVNKVSSLGRSARSLGQGHFPETPAVFMPLPIGQEGQGRLMEFMPSLWKP